MVCPSVLRLALVAPGASTLKFASTQSSKNAGSQCGDLTIVEWKSLGSSPTLKNRARSTSITVPVVTTTVRLPDLRTAVGPMVGSYFHVSHFIVPSASEITDQSSSSGTNWLSCVPPIPIRNVPPTPSLCAVAAASGSASGASIECG